jgi:hypothetical protein
MKMKVPIRPVDTVNVKGIGARQARGITPWVGVVVAGGTEDEIVRWVQFLVIDGLEEVAEALLSLHLLQSMGAVMVMSEGTCLFPKRSGDYFSVPLRLPACPPVMGEVHVQQPTEQQEQQRRTGFIAAPCTVLPASAVSESQERVRHFKALMLCGDVESNPGPASSYCTLTSVLIA